MITKIENSVKITFEFTIEEMQKIYGALNTADVSLLKRIKYKKENKQEEDVKFLKSCEDEVNEFIENFNPARYYNMRTKYN